MVLCLSIGLSVCLFGWLASCLPARLADSSREATWMPACERSLWVPADPSGDKQSLCMRGGHWNTIIMLSAATATAAAAAVAATAAVATGC